MGSFSTLNARYVIYSVFLVFIVSLLAACDSSVATPTVDDISPVIQSTADPEETEESIELRPTLSPPDDDSGIIAGYIVNQNGPMPDDTVVWVLELKRTEEGYGVYFLNTLSTPSYRLESDDYFLATDLAPGEYVIVAGVSPETAAAINREDGQAKVFELESGSVLDIGRQVISLFIPPTIEAIPDEAYPPLASTPASAYP